ncbi:hypothetical protein QTO30_01850 [Yoonia sp. GPGPB17]|uniref:hypothetical protein n=1 Tax=Yoonia sp. GPGPB17 TaxID=3026147 RepID=UPI0030C3CA6D
MGLGDMMGKAAGLMGGSDFDLGAKMEELGIDPAMLENLDIEGVKAMIEEKGIDLSMLDSLGIDLDEVIAKFKGEV